MSDKQSQDVKQPGASTNHGRWNDMGSATRRERLWSGLDRRRPGRPVRARLFFGRSQAERQGRWHGSPVVLSEPRRQLFQSPSSPHHTRPVRVATLSLLSNSINSASTVLPRFFLATVFPYFPAASAASSQQPWLSTLRSACRCAQDLPPQPYS